MSVDAWRVQAATSWKLSLPCTRAEAEAIALADDPLPGLDPAPVLLTDEPDPDAPDAWMLHAYFEGEPDADALARVRALVRTDAPGTLEKLADEGRQHDPGALAQVAVTVARAQLVAERLTISAAERLFDTGGASATARALNLDRHWRNARTIAGHSPLAYKAYAAGNYAVNRTAPPTNGYF